MTYQVSVSAQLIFNFDPTDNVTDEVLAGFQEAADTLSDLFTDDVTVNIDIDWRPLGGALGAAGSSRQTIDYSNVLAALQNDATSGDDFSAISNLPNDSFNLLMNRTSQNGNSENPYLDNNASSNNTTIRMTTANAKALGLRDSTNGSRDVSIVFNSNANFDFDVSDGVPDGFIDFVGVAIHEIGHGMGFVSGVDGLDSSPGQTENNYLASTLDLFRYSDDTAFGIELDFTADNRLKYFSIDGGETMLGEFSRGPNFGDGFQASHWRDDQFLGAPIGILDPRATRGGAMFITQLDIQSWDVIGWDSAAIPEPASMIATLAFLGCGLMRRRRRAIA